jgi:hypothetical protein
MLMLKPASILMLEVSRWLQLCFQKGNAGLYVNHKIEFYPAKVFPAWEPVLARREFECQDEDELTSALAQILASDRVMQVIRSLIAQSKSM